MKTFPVPGLALAAAIFCAASGFAKEPPAGGPDLGRAGPMVGHVTDGEALVWACAGAGVALAVEYREQGTAGAWAKTAMPATAKEHWAAKAALAGLKPATSYEYQVLRDGSADGLWGGTFTTAPPAGKPAHFTMAVSSCMNSGKFPQQLSWETLVAQRPAFHIIAGDSVYSNSTDPELIWAAHLRQRAVPQFAGAIRNLPTYAVWDDHDFGPNDSDGTEPGKERSLRAWGQLWVNPPTGTAETPGAFFRFGWGDVDFFLADGRYYRTPKKEPDGPDKTMLGKAQLAWLIDGLKSSRAPFKVLVSGSTLGERKDGWDFYETELRELYDAIRREKIGGVIYVGGDIHYCKIVPHLPAETGSYAITEVISSGIGATGGKGKELEQGFATIEFDTTAADPTARIRLIRVDGTISKVVSLPASALQ